ncbi:MAG: PaaI family thioesterase [Acidimicrobiia bacterium]|nr:PaaI family thioesterase [Acidimicrobiia bacterium]MYB73317.1 PaaI family thioesterase [Acidimicrobiia bacterium]
MTDQEHPETASAYRLAELLGDLPHPDDFGPEAYELVERTRDLVAAVSANDADPATRAEIAAALADITERLRAAARDPHIVVAKDHDGTIYNLTQAGSGLLNPHAPRLKFDPVPLPDPDAEPRSVEMRATVTLTEAHSGPPHRAHGGVVATILDEALGTAATRAGATGLTAGINIRYKTGVPLHTPLEVTCRYSHTEGRKHIATGEIRAGDTICATAEAIFITEPRS